MVGAKYRAEQARRGKTTAQQPTQIQANVRVWRDQEFSSQQALPNPQHEHGGDDLDVMSDDGIAAVESQGSRRKTMRVSGDNEVTIFPRKKAGQDKLGSNRPPIVITREVLENYFDMPQQLVCKKLGICATVIKKVCRQLGIEKWPYKGNKIDLRKRGLGPAARKDFLDDSPSPVPTSSSTCISNEDSSSSERKDDPSRRAAPTQVAPQPKRPTPQVAVPQEKKDVKQEAAAPSPLCRPSASKPSPQLRAASPKRVALKSVPKLPVVKNEPPSTDIYVAGGPSVHESFDSPMDNPSRFGEGARGVPLPPQVRHEHYAAGSPYSPRMPRMPPTWDNEQEWNMPRSQPHMSRRAEEAPAHAPQMYEPTEQELAPAPGLLDCNEGCDLGWLVAPEPKVFAPKPDDEEFLSPFYRNGPQVGGVEGASAESTENRQV
eukprot:CAMPEP_0196733534 /NCGR_PEP_ID=MMETSP1091-20130531/12541_1 /TAXON_ID=302021 /ORGANISM="Rhodomonas sp., Strain CCMP768" /LENGTH=431 /DNA_ID=CAMNT_0042076911 /DNA_START=137 /DNA_END=1435 /DNA_ORIENTATION=+